MNASEPGSKDWWLVVQSMPADEALIYLNDYRASLIEHNAGKSFQIAADGELSRVNAEIRRFNVVKSESQWKRASRNVLPPELFEAVFVEVRRLEDEAQGIKWGKPNDAREDACEPRDAQRLEGARAALLR